MCFFFFGWPLDDYDGVMFGMNLWYVYQMLQEYSWPRIGATVFLYDIMSLFIQASIYSCMLCHCLYKLHVRYGSK